jgi:hypothetical protein
VAPRAYWKGYLKLSLVSCPIALFPATSEREKISFNQLNKETGKCARAFARLDWRNLGLFCKAGRPGLPCVGRMAVPTTLRHLERADFVEVATTILLGVFPYGPDTWRVSERGEQVKTIWVHGCQVD